MRKVTSGVNNSLRLNILLMTSKYVPYGREVSVVTTDVTFHIKVQTSENTRSLFYPLNFIYLFARYNILVLIVNIIGIPTCSQHLLT